MCHKFATLCDTPFHSHMADVLIGTAFQQFVGEGLGKITTEGTGNNGNLRELCQRFDAGNNGDIDAQIATALHKGKILGIVIEKLGDTIFRTIVNLLLEISNILLQVRSFFVLLGIACHTIVEGGPFVIHPRSVIEPSFVETVDLPLQFGGMAVSSRSGTVVGVFFGLVTTQEEKIFDAENLHVNKLVFRVLT